MDANLEMTVAQVQAMQQLGQDFVLLDVRNPDELEICKIEGATALPLHELPSRYSELPKDKLIVIYCHTGRRSMRALEFLQAHGFKAKNMYGGIEAWAQEIDPHMSRY